MMQLSATATLLLHFAASPTQVVQSADTMRRLASHGADSVLVAYYDLADTPTNGGSEKIQFDGQATAGAFLRAL